MPEAVASAPAAVAPVKAAPQPSGGDVPIPQISSMNTGAQGVRPAPSGTIPPALQPMSERPESAMSKVKERLRNKSLGQPPQTEQKPPDQKKAPEAPAAPVKEEQKPEAPAPEPEESDEEDLMGAKIGEEEKTEEPPKSEKKEEATAAADDKDKKGKVNPWNLLKEEKAARAKLEQEVADARRLVPNAEQRKAEIAEVESLKKRNEELEKHIQFVDYQASEEFKTKYEQPYKAQWKTSMTELKGVLAQTETGERELEASDLLELVNMNKIQARQRANEMFGDFANDVMAERDKIRGAYDAQQNALKQAKEQGVIKSQEATRAHQETYQKLNGEVHEIFNKAVDSISKDPKVSEFITAKEGDAKHNELLTRGLEMVDEAFKMNPMDPSLTPKQRETIVKKHAAVRFRAAGYGPLKHAYVKLMASHKAMAAKLAEYEGTTPTRGGFEPAAAATPGGGSALARMQSRLRARAKPAA